MVRYPAPQPIISHTRLLSVVYLPAFCNAVVEPDQPGVAVVLESDLDPMVRVSSRCQPLCDPRDRIVLIPHGKPLRPPVKDGETCDPYLFRMAQALRAGFRRNVTPPPSYLESLAEPVVRHLERNYIGRTRQRDRAGLSDARLVRALAFIDDNLFREFSIEALADAACLSPFHFRHMFKRSTGLAPQTFVTRRRISAAAEMLASTHLPIAEVARRAGYANQAHFSTVFGRVAGVTPSGYRWLARHGQAPALPLFGERKAA